MKLKLFLFIFFSTIFFYSNSALAGDGSKIHWVSPTGSAAWADCERVTDPKIYCSVSTASNNAAAGETVYYKGGTYSYGTMYASILEPKNSGTPTSKILFAAAPGETPVFKGMYGKPCANSGAQTCRQWGILLNGNSYIIIDGLTFAEIGDMALIRANAHHVEVRNCTFQDGGSFQMVEACSGGGQYTCYVSHIWVHHNNFLRTAAGGCASSGSQPSEGGDALRIGYPNPTCNQGLYCTQGLNHHITLENNYLGGAGHALLDTYGTQLVIKNNVFHNEPWYQENNKDCIVNWPASGYTNPEYNGKYGHRNWQMTDDFGRDGTWNLAEGNRSGHASINPNNDGADAFDLASSKNIIRYNSFYNAMNNGLMPKYYLTGNGAVGGFYNRIFNNTIYHNGYGYPYYHSCAISTCPEPQAGIHYYGGAQAGNIIKNNIVYDNASFGYRGWDIEPNANNTVLNNLVTSNGDPKFVNPNLSQPASKTLPDLNLLSTSPARNAGMYLTQAVGSGSNSKTLAVNDALYFQDGSWGSDLARGATLFPDWIAIGTVNNAVQISSINYSNNIITLASPVSWSDGANVWLYKNSSNQPVLFGSAPDQGAYEYVESAPNDFTPPSQPANLSAQSLSWYQIKLSWSASSDNAGVAGYRVERCSGASCSNFALIASPSETTFTDAGLSAETNYSYRVRAFDTSNNYSSYSNTVSTQTQPKGNLVAAYSFNEGSGTTLTDSSGNNNNGTLKNGPVWTSGKYGTALSFDGADDYVLMNTDPISASTVTACAWIYPAVLGNRNSILGILTYVFSLANGTLSVTSNSFADNASSATSAVAANTWTHVCAVRLNSGTATLYINGNISRAAGQNNPISNAGWTMAIGARGQYPAWYFSGKIDEVRIYNKALSQSEIQNDMNSPIGGGTDTQAPAAPAGLRIN